MPAQTQPTRWVASETVVSSPVADEVALLDLGSDTYFTLNGSGAHVWSLLQTPATVPELSQSLASRYGRPADECLADIHELLAELDENGLVRAIGPE